MRTLAPAATSVTYQSVKFNITTVANPFVGAGPEVDQAWREISYDGKKHSPAHSVRHESRERAERLSRANIWMSVGDQMISEAELQRLDMPKSSLKVKHPTTGAEGYRVGIEVFHQLHCINLLRKATYKEYYEPLGGEFGKGSEALRMHIGMLSCGGLRTA
jgi:hypothetical protein